jgi:hypothetical protein
MIRVEFKTERHALLPPEYGRVEVADEPYQTETQVCDLTFRELVEAMREFSEYEANGCLTSWDEGTYTSMRLLDTHRGRYWSAAYHYPRSLHHDN